MLTQHPQAARLRDGFLWLRHIVVINKPFAARLRELEPLKHPLDINTRLNVFRDLFNVPLQINLSDPVIRIRQSARPAVPVLQVQIIALHCYELIAGGSNDNHILDPYFARAFNRLVAGDNPAFLVQQYRATRA